MKKMKLWMMAAILFCGVGVMTSCNGNANADNSDDEQGWVFMDALEKYMVDSVGVHYSQGELCIPSIVVVETNEDNPDSLLVWGDFWAFNYNVAGDTLKTVSGGDHPGMMVVQKIDGKYKVTSFDQVEDGSRFLPSAKRIFGEWYEDFHVINSREEVREAVRARFIARYVKAQNLPVKYYQDYGWPAKEIPVE